MRVGDLNVTEEIRKVLLAPPRPGAYLTLSSEGKVVWQYRVDLAQGCWCPDARSPDQYKFSLVSATPPSDCLGGEEIWQRGFEEPGPSFA